MQTTTLGIKLDRVSRDRLKAAAASLDRTPHWLMKIAIMRSVHEIELGAKISDFVTPEALVDDIQRHSVSLKSDL